jgi:cell wall integrity and stress response component
MFTMPISLTLSSLLLAAALGVIGTHNGFSERASPAMTYVGCYSSSDGLTNRTSYIYQSFGWCLNECIKTDAATFALRGHDCLCGTKLPPPSAMVPKGQCNQACPGFSSDICMLPSSDSSSLPPLADEFAAQVAVTIYIRSILQAGGVPSQ